MLEKAIEIAKIAHANQIDKAEKPYIHHLIRVMDSGKTEVEKICGVLHDLIEDTDWTFDDLKNEGFSDEIITIIDCVTKRENEDYSSFIERVKQNPIAVKIKINDLKDNMDITRLEKIDTKDIERLNKYLNAYHYLKTTLTSDL